VIVLVRHGSTDQNLRGLLLGRADPSLSTEGVEQSAALAALLEREGRPARIVSSPLRRTRETAAAIAAPWGMTVDDEPGLLEMDYGEWDERPLADIPRDVWERWHADPDFAPPGGESLREVQRRVSDTMVALQRESSADGRLIAVSHVSPIKAAVLWGLGLGDRPQLAWRFRLDTASITRLAPGPVGPVVTAFNERADRIKEQS
jgi:broad specificity phosphatase PhoE